MINTFYNLFFIYFLFSCNIISQNRDFITVLGTVQDGGLPHIGCDKKCCNGKSDELKVTSLGLTLSDNQGFYIFEASPDFSYQLSYMSKKYKTSFNGIFVTHAHIGHYTGLMYLGKEALGSKNIPVYVMNRMSKYLTKNGPWSQLVSQSNIKLVDLANNKSYDVSKKVSIKPFIVPHRDEFSETVGFFIYGSKKTVLFLPDIDKWNRWSTSLIDIVKSTDVLFLDATFYDNSEINYRPVDLIPHPFVVETLKKLESLSANEKKKIFFIHMNHTNPMLNPDSEIALKVISKGFNIAKIGQIFEL
tara:strand:- start:963 stop:1871 length:909 start_codon:yes stop_codon:yes gene_type:complete